MIIKCSIANSNVHLNVEHYKMCTYKTGTGTEMKSKLELTNNVLFKRLSETKINR